MHSFARLVRVVSQNAILAKHVGQLLERGQQEKFAVVLQELSKRSGTSLLFCRELLDLEFVRKVNGEEATILRENSLCTRYISLFTVNASKNFLKRLLTSFVMEAGVENPKEIWFRDRVSDLFDALCDGDLLTSLPRSVRAVVAIIAEMAERYCPERRYPLMAGYLFLRLVNPCLASPQSYGLLPNEYVLPRTAQQNLVVFSKVLQHLCNNTTYSQYPMLQKWIEDAQPRMELFLDRVVTDESNADPPFSDQIPGEPELVLPSAVDPVLLYDLLSILSSHRSALVEVRARLEKANSESLVELYDELLAAMQEASPNLEEESASYSTSGQFFSNETEDFASVETANPLSPGLTSRVAADSDPPHKESKHSRQKKSVDLARKGGLVGNMRDKALKLMNFGSDSKNSNTSGGSGNSNSNSNSSNNLNSKGNAPPSPGGSLSALAASTPSVASATSSSSSSSSSLSSKKVLKELLLNRINLEDPSLMNHLSLFLLLRVMVSKKDGLNFVVPERQAFQAADAVSWLEESLGLSHRGNALVWLRMGQSMGALFRCDGGFEKAQDDGSLFSIDVGLFRAWDALVGKGDNPELDVIAETVGSACSRVIALNPRSGGVEEVIRKHLDALTTLAIRLVSVGNGATRCEVQQALDWLVLFGSVTREQAIDMLRVLYKAKLIVSPLLSEVLRDLVLDDVFCLINCVNAAFANQRGRHAALWNRASLVSMLSGDLAVSDRVRCEFGVETLLADQSCGSESFHASVSDAASRCVNKKNADYWLALWNRLEEVDVFRCRHVARLDHALQTLSEVEFWFVTTTGCDCLLEQQSCIPSVIGFSDTVLDGYKETLGKGSSSSGLQSRFFKRSNSSKSGASRKSGTFDGEWIGGEEERKSPRNLIRGSSSSGVSSPISPARPRPPLPLSQAPGSRSSAVAPATQDNSVEIDVMSRSDGLASVAPRSGRNNSPRSTPSLFNKPSSARNSSAKPIDSRPARTNSGASSELPSRPARTNSGASAESPPPRQVRTSSSSGI